MSKQSEGRTGVRLPHLLVEHSVSLPPSPYIFRNDDKEAELLPANEMEVPIRIAPPVPSRCHSLSG